jgi:hypothetical protein
VDTTIIPGLLSDRGSGGGTKRATLQGIQKPKEALPPPDAKPEYFSVPGTVTFINPEQTMYYMAAPENSRKVSSRPSCVVSILTKHHEASFMAWLEHLGAWSVAVDNLERTCILNI